MVRLDYTPVCTTELGMTAKLQPEFEKRSTLVLGLSVDSVEDHHGAESHSFDDELVCTSVMTASYIRCMCGVRAMQDG